MPILHYFSYLAVVTAFAFMTLSLASGLLYISELIEEHSRLAKVVGQRGTYLIIAFHVLLYCFDSLPFLQTLFSILCHAVYLQNFSSTWPLISLSSASFIASCALAITNHFVWFLHFSHITRDAKQSYQRLRGPVPDVPGFTDIAAFFGTCVWLVPLFLFLSLSANDNALPTGMPTTPNSGTSSRPSPQRSNSSLFKSMFSMISRDNHKFSDSDASNGLIAPPNVTRSASSSVPPSPTSVHSPMHSPYLGPPPRSPRTSTYSTHSEADNFASRRIHLASPPRRAPQVVTSTTGGLYSATLTSRQPSSSGRSLSAEE
ncbi:transmembrane adaptor Erv26-domain-containing protein [Phlebopus sp. FC_14]|nr:transmembrane adaptor Erv26-domain-containing protein [Phlebopus sp. FC_14]